MSLDFLSGFLLIAVVIVLAFFVMREVLDDGQSDGQKPKRKFFRLPERTPGRQAEPINDHLIGSTGKVISHSDNSARPMTVRVHPELWPARQKSMAEEPLPIGTVVKVTAVDGAVLVVEASDDADASPDAG